MLTRSKPFKRAVASVLVALLSTPFSAIGQTTSTGLTGLGEMRTPDTIPDNAGEITLVPARYSVISNGVASGVNESTRITPSLGYTQGFGDRFELGVMVPFRMHDFKEMGAEREVSDSGIANVPLAVKYRFLEWNRFRFAGDAGVEIPTSSKDDDFGSGNVGYSANLLGTMDVSSLVFSGSLGYQSTDTCQRCTYTGPTVAKPEVASLVNGAAGLSYSTPKGYGAFLEVHGMNAYSEAGRDGAIDGDPDLYALLGGRLPIGQRFAVTGYGGAGLAGAANTKAVGALMLHYSFASTRPLARSTYGSSSSTVVASTPTPAPTPTAVAVATPVVVATPRPTPKPTVVAMATPVPKKPLTAAQIALRSKMAPNAEFILDGVTFVSATADALTPIATAPLSDLAAVLAYHPEAVIRLETHVDPTDASAMVLSQARGDAVAAKLQLLGVSANQVSAKGLGGTKSLFPSFVEATKAKNRRVVLHVVVPPRLDTVAATPVVRRPLTPSQSALLAKMAPQANFVLEGVAFSTATGSTLRPAANAPLNDLATVLQNHPEAALRIEGHLDPTDPSPVALSQKRADAVVAKLKAYGVAPGQVEAKGMGGAKSLFPSFVEAMKAKNRRTELTVISPPVTTGAAPDATPVLAGKARVKVLGAKGRSAQAVKLANALKQAGTKITTIANIPESRMKSEIYYTAPFKAEAEALAKQINVPGGPRLRAYKTLGATVDIVVVVANDLK